MDDFSMSVRRYSWEDDEDEEEEALVGEGTNAGNREAVAQHSPPSSPEPSVQIPYRDEDLTPAPLTTTIARTAPDSPRGRNAPEVLLPDSAPEVLDRAVLEEPEVVPGSNPPLCRNSSLYQPMLTDEDGRSSMGGGSYYDPPKEWTAGAAAAAAMGPPAHDLEDAKAPLLLVPPPPAARKYCGLPRRRFIIVASTVAAVLVLAIVLGVALGLKLQHKAAAEPDDPYAWYDNATMLATTNTGLAVITDFDDPSTQVLYYQGPDGYLYENVWYGSTNDWSLEYTGNNPNDSQVVWAIVQTPLTALTYAVHGVAQRQLFYLDNSGQLVDVHSLNISDWLTTRWSDASILSQPAWPVASANAIGLAACLVNTTSGISDIRLYYGASTGGVQELIYGFDTEAWTQGTFFKGADQASGVGCAVNNVLGADVIDVFWRNTTTNSLQQARWDFSDDANEDWTYFTPTNVMMKQGSDLAVMTPSLTDQTVYIFFQDAADRIGRGILSPLTNALAGWTSLAAGSNRTRLATVFTADQSVYFFQNDSAPGWQDAYRVWTGGLDRSGQNVWAGGPVLGNATWEWASEQAQATS